MEETIEIFMYRNPRNKYTMFMCYYDLPWVP